MNEDYKKILTIFASHRGVKAEDVVGYCTLREACVTRYMIYAYLHNELKISASHIGEAFGRTRVNILRGIRVLKGWMHFHSEIKTEYQSIIEMIEGAE